MRLTGEEKAMRDGRDGRTTARAMDVLLRYGTALGAESLVETRNVCGTVTADAALAAIQAGTVQAGVVLVMRGAGPSGGPAMGGRASRVVFALDGAGLGDQVAMLTDGHLSGLVCKGLVVAGVSPESARGGPIALVRNGDTVTIDLDTRACGLEVSADEMQRRRAAWAAPAPMFDRGRLQIYRRNVGPLSQGAVLTRHPLPSPSHG